MPLAGISDSSLADHGDALTWCLLWSSPEQVVSHRLSVVVPLLESSLKAERSEEICDTSRLKNTNSEVKFQIKCLLGAKCAAEFCAVVAHWPRCSEQSEQAGLLWALMAVCSSSSSSPSRVLLFVHQCKLCFIN